MIDETYVEFAPDVEEITAIPLTREFTNLMVLRGVSKFYAAPGMRLGYGITGNMEFLSKNANSNINLASVGGGIPQETVRMAIAIVGLLPILIVFPFVQKYFVKGISIDEKDVQDLLSIQDTGAEVTFQVTPEEKKLSLDGAAKKVRG